MSQLRVSHLSDARQFAGASNAALKRTEGLSSAELTMTIDRALSVTGDITATGNLAAVNATLTGNLIAVGGTFSGDVAAVNANLSGVYKVSGTQVVGARSTGWTADTGTAEKSAHATYTAGATLTFTNPPTAGEMSALATRLAAVEAALQGVTRGQKAIKDMALGHGLAGA
jgi:hypothetical protein